MARLHHSCELEGNARCAVWIQLFVFKNSMLGFFVRSLPILSLKKSFDYLPLIKGQGVHAETEGMKACRG